MSLQKRKLAKILGVYIDDEADLVKALEKKYNNQGLEILVKTNNFGLFSGLNLSFKNFLEHNFLILGPENVKLRKYLNKPYLFFDDTYEVTFISFNKKESYTFELNFSSLKEDFDLNLNKNQGIFQGIREEGKFFVEIKRLCSGKLREKVFLEEKILDTENYAMQLKKMILDDFLLTKSWDHFVKRSLLWTDSPVTHDNLDYFRKNLKVSDFGIKDVVQLREFFIHFRFSVENEELFELDDSIKEYQKQIQSLLKSIENNSLIIKI